MSRWREPYEGKATEHALPQLSPQEEQHFAVSTRSLQHQPSAPAVPIQQTREIPDDLCTHLDRWVMLARV
jgi:hypothetical protein